MIKTATFQKTLSPVCAVCGGTFGINKYELKAVDTKTGETINLCKEWAHLECIFKLLNKAESRYGRN